MSTELPPAFAFLSIKTQFDNLGDALINRELCRLVAARVETFVDFSRAPIAFQRAMQVEGLPHLRVLRNHGFATLMTKMLKLRLTGRDCYFFLNPGGLGGKKKPLRGLLAALAYNCVLGLLRIAGVKICHTGISFDPMGAPERFVARWRRRQLHSFTVRDQLSFNYLHSIGMDADGIVPDLSFNLHCLPTTTAINTRNTIAFSFRFDGKVGSNLIESAVRQVMAELGSSYDYSFVAQVARDEIGMRNLQEACSKGGARTSMFVCHNDIAALSAHYLECRAIYSNRLHALLLAAHSGASPYALLTRGTQPKIEGLFRDLRLDKRLCYINHVGFKIPPIEPPEMQQFTSECVKLQSFFNDLLGAI